VEELGFLKHCSLSHQTWVVSGALDIELPHMAGMWQRSISADALVWSSKRPLEAKACSRRIARVTDIVLSRCCGSGMIMLSSCWYICFWRATAVHQCVAYPQAHPASGSRNELVRSDANPPVPCVRVICIQASKSATAGSPEYIVEISLTAVDLQ
jgi:hypothetical protein